MIPQDDSAIKATASNAAAGDSTTTVGSEGQSAPAASTTATTSVLPTATAFGLAALARKVTEGVKTANEERSELDEIEKLFARLAPQDEDAQQFTVDRYGNTLFGEGVLGMVFAPQKSGKSLALATIVASHHAVTYGGFHRVKGAPQPRAIYINNENNGTTFKRYLRSAFKCAGLDYYQAVAAKQLIPLDVKHLEDVDVLFGTEDKPSALKAYIDAQKAAGTPITCIAIDTAQRLLPSRDINNAGECAELISSFRALADDYGLTVAFLTHDRPTSSRGVVTPTNLPSGHLGREGGQQCDWAVTVRKEQCDDPDRKAFRITPLDEYGRNGLLAFDHLFSIHLTEGKVTECEDGKTIQRRAVDSIGWDPDPIPTPPAALTTEQYGERVLQALIKTPDLSAGDLVTRVEYKSRDTRTFTKNILAPLVTAGKIAAMEGARGRNATPTTYHLLTPTFTIEETPF